MSIITEDNDLYFYRDKQLIKLDVHLNKVDSAFSKDYGVVLDDNNKVIIVDLLK